jgi:phosphopantothenoylcysteine decarboxylase/phosphopantothenate--cysteine ligase
MKILITAGPTCEDIDPVRYITNRSSGRMGYSVAAEALSRGHEVVLVSGPTRLDPPAGADLRPVRSAGQMCEACLEVFEDCDAAVLVAAVADYRPAEPLAEKIAKSHGELTLRLVRTEDIARRLGQRKGRRVLVGFALETAAHRARAESKLDAKNLDAVVLNDPATFGAEQIEAELLVRGEGWIAETRGTKLQLSGQILDLLERLVSARR